jgi:MFS family permease
MSNTAEFTEAQAKRVFLLSCIALTVTSMTFAIRAGIIGDLGIQYGLTTVQMGWILGMGTFGFPVATMLGGILYNAIGAKKIVWFAFAGHLIGIGLTITSSSFWGLMISTFLVSFANGLVEAGCNPMIADLYPKNKTTMLNKFHVWFPGGLVIGALISAGMTSMNMGWELQVAVIIIPTLIYGALMLGCVFPRFDKIANSTSNNFKHLFSPMYLFLIFCMTLTATSELGTSSWINQILGASGAHPMLILALVTGIMAVGRFFAGPLVQRFAPAGVLLISAILTSLGLFLMIQLQGSAVYFAAVVFALGVTYFWPTMIGCVGEYVPRSGALGMSLMGGAGMLSVTIWSPIIGSWIESAANQAKASGLTGNDLALASGQAALGNLVIFPLILIVAFAGFYWFMRKEKSEQTVHS